MQAEFILAVAAYSDLFRHKWHAQACRNTTNPSQDRVSHTPSPSPPTHRFVIVVFDTGINNDTGIAAETDQSPRISNNLAHLVHGKAAAFSTAMPTSEIKYLPFPNFQFTNTYIDGLRNRDTATTEHFFQYFSRALTCSLRRRILSTSLVEDIQQETFARVLRIVSSGGVHRPDSFGSFVFSVSRNVTREYLRCSAPYCQEQDHESTDVQPSPEALAHAAELRQVLERTMAHLAERDRRLVSMALVEELSYEEMARQLSTSPSTVRVLVHRAKTRLRQRMSSALSQKRNALFFETPPNWHCQLRHETERLAP